MSTAWLALLGVLMVGGMGPAVLLGCRGDPVARLVGLELLSAVAVVAMVVFSHAVDQTSYLIVPLVLAVLAAAGTLVFTRLLGPRP